MNYEDLTADQKVNFLENRMPIMLEMIKDMHLNIQHFLVPKGSITTNSIFYKQFYERYNILFPKNQVELLD